MSQGPLPKKGKSMSRSNFHREFSLLLRKKGVTQTSIPYYISFLKSWGGELRRNSGRDRGALFEEWIRELGRNKNREDYQIRQAMRAVKWAHGEVLN